MAHVKIDELTKAYGSLKVFADLNINIEHGEFIALLGPSGCGKSTLLRCIAGLEDVTNGDILYDGKSIVDIPPSNRGAAMVFQSYALYPHKTVAENMGFALKIAKVERGEIDRRVREAADILNIVPLLEKRPRELSGGQRQRVAIGRAIVRKPEVFLFDEPLSNLDAELRAKMRVELLRLHKQIDATMIYVTHDQIEAMTLADRIVVFSEGRIEQIGAPLALYENPSNLFVATFIGSPKMNVIAGADLASAGISFTGKRPMVEGADAGSIHSYGIRPEHMSLKAGDTPGKNRLVGEIAIFEKLGGDSFYHVDVEGIGTVVARTLPTETFEEGERVTLSLEPEHLHAFDDAGRTLTYRAEG